uniref:Uncharacterized protein n=1 Tax=Romanomermis culicivorax TaxID=13658 RepID=A0A915L843_ROMCU
MSGHSDQNNLRRCPHDIPSSTNLPRRGDLLQSPINGLEHPIPKMNIPVVDQQQRRPTNKPTQLFDTYH